MHISYAHTSLTYITLYYVKLQNKHANRWMLGSFILLYAVLTLYGSYLMYTGKSALVLFYLMNSCVQCEVFEI